MTPLGPTVQPFPLASDKRNGLQPIQNVHDVQAGVLAARAGEIIRDNGFGKERAAVRSGRWRPIGT